MRCSVAGYPVRGPALWRVGGFQPLQMPGCVLWMRADLGITLISGAGSGWANQASTGGSATQGTALSRPTWNATGFGTNSRPYFSFDGSNDYMDLTGLGAIGSAYGFFAAVRYRSYVTSDCIASVVDGVSADYNSNSTAVFGHVSAGTTLEHYVNGARGNATRPTANTAAILSCQQQQGKSDVYVNGTAGSQGSLTASLTAATLRIGARSIPGASNYSRVDIAELILCVGALSTATIAAIHRYLGGYHGVTVA